MFATEILYKEDGDKALVQGLIDDPDALKKALAAASESAFLSRHDWQVPTSRQIRDGSSETDISIRLSYPGLTDSEFLWYTTMLLTACMNHLVAWCQKRPNLRRNMLLKLVVENHSGTYESAVLAVNVSTRVVLGVWQCNLQEGTALPPVV